MKLITKEQLEQLKRNGSPENRDKDHKPVIKLFLPGTNFTWLLTEINPEEPTIAFDLCDLGMGFPELGYVSLEELESLRVHGVFKVERDLHFKAKYPISIYAKAASLEETITEDEEKLKEAANQ